MNAGHESTEVVNANVAAVIVNWRQSQRTIEAVHALARQTVRPAVVVVVDNGSGDDSVNQLRAALPSALIVVRDTNGGFGAGCNVGIERAMSMGVDFVWLINNDAMPEEHCLEHLLARANSDPEIGVVGACIREPKGTIVDHAGCVMSPFSFNCRYTLSETEIAGSRYAWITGASMLLTTSALKTVGLFDIGYFMYWEDADLCHRLRCAGFKMAISEQALVRHEAGTSSNDMRLSRYQWHIDSQLRWIIHNYSNTVYGLFLVYFRHFIKSIISCDGARFVMTAKSLKKFIALNKF
ncbi:MAG: glycosyltransferase family 2 protein [Rhodoferax sp.]